MAEWLFTFLDTTSYFSNNLICLLSFMEFALSKSIVLLAYIDLLVDVAESFSVMIVVLVVISSALTLLIHIHSLNPNEGVSNNRASYGLAYNMFTKFSQFKNRL